MKITDLDELVKWWGDSKNNYKTRKENKLAWKVSLKEIKNRNFNLDFENPYIAKQETYDPELLILEYTKMQKDIRNLQNNLRNILSDAFKTSKS